MPQRLMVARGVFVAGTDTGVGKTLIACALLRGFAARGLRVVAMKPVAAGAVRRRGVWQHDDVVQLRAAANVDAPLAAVNPYCFAPPIAPHIAAQEAGVVIRMALIAKSYAQLARKADRVVVEGAGGLLVPLGGTLSGEHGIGSVQKDYMDIAFNADQLSIMRAIKTAFDPQGIMNPGKVLP